MKFPTEFRSAGISRLAKCVLLASACLFVCEGLSCNLQAQGVLAFQNLDFEQAVISFDPNGYYPGSSVAANLALPGWTPNINGGQCKHRNENRG